MPDAPLRISTTSRVARTGDGLESSNVVTPPYETRRIVWALGKEARVKRRTWPILNILETARATPEERAHLDFCPPALLSRRAPALDLIPQGPGRFRYIAHAQGVIYEIETVTQKDEFDAALRSPGTMVIYNGHARYGRGPCFGKASADADDGAPGEDWEDGITGATDRTGIFRMGFPYLGLDVVDVLHHGYTANLVPASERLGSADCHPELRAALGLLRGRSLEAIEAMATSQETLDPHPPLRALVHNALPDNYWTFRRHGTVNVVIRAGWQHTRSAPYDLGSYEPSARAFCHFGCSTYIHNYPVMRKLKGWTREGNERYCYWTTAPSTGIESTLWFYYLLAYDRPSGYRSWAPLLADATRRANQGLAGSGAQHRVI